MRYLVTAQASLFDSEQYKVISLEESLTLLNTLEIIGLDTETLGFDVYTKELLSVQLGCYDWQVLVDCKSIDITKYKDLLQDPTKLFILTNAKFDLKFFYHKRIVIPKVFDTYLAEKLLWLGYPYLVHPWARSHENGKPKMIIPRTGDMEKDVYGLGLGDQAKMYLDVDLDKSVRGNIIWEGLTERVIVYGCDDVKYLELIMNKQLEELKKKDLLIAVNLENEFVKCLSYIEYCGVKLDIPKWKAKMEKDRNEYIRTLDALNKWVVEYGNPKYIKQDFQGDLFLGFSGPKCKINWNSSQQVIPLLEELGFKLDTWDKESNKMKKSIEASVIEPQKSVSPLADVYLDYKSASKVTSVYGQNFLNSINPVSGRIHTNFNQLMDTGENLPYISISA